MQHYTLRDLDQDDLTAIPFTPTILIGFYLSGEEERLKKQYQKLKTKFPDIDIIACSVESNIQSNFPHINPDKIQFVCFDMRKDAYHISYVDHEKPLYALKNENNYNALFFSIYENTNIEGLLTHLKDTLGERSVYGAIAARATIDDSVSTSVFYNGKFQTKKNSTLVWFINKAYYDVQGISIHNFISVGLELAVTKSKEKIILEIENTPALDLIEDIIGELDDDGILHFEYPFFIKNQKEISSISLATIKSIDREAKSIELFREIHENTKIMLSIPMSRDTQDKTIEKLMQTKFNFGFSFLFTCAAFKWQWDEIERLHIMRIAKELKSNFIGCHTFGEVAPLAGSSSSYLQNQTLTLVNINEKVDNHA